MTLVSAGTIRKACSECQGEGQCTWQARITGERTMHTCLGCDGVGFKFVKDFPLASNLPSMAAGTVGVVKNVSPASQLSSMAAEAVGVALPSAFPTFPVDVVPSRVQREPFRQKHLHATAKSNSSAASLSLSPNAASQCLQAILVAASGVDAAVLHDEPAEPRSAEQASATVTEEEVGVAALSNPEAETPEQPELELTAKEKAKIIKIKRRCPGCFVSEAEDPIRHDQPLIDHHLSDMHPSQKYHMQPGGCMSGEPVSSDEEEDEDHAPPSKKTRVADQDCAGGCVAASMYRALSDDHPFNCVKCGKDMTLGQVREQGIKNLGVDCDLFD